MSPDRLFDLGLQPERTALAWRRTTLALLVAGLVVLRLLPPVFGGWGLALALASLVSAGVVRVLAARRAHEWEKALLDPQRLRPGGALLLGVSLLVSAGAVTGAFLVARAVLHE